MSNNMKLTKSINRKIGSKEYHKFIVTIPNKHLEKLGWDDHTELNMVVRGKKLIIEKQ